MKPQQGIFTSYKRLKDKSVNVTYNLQELNSEDLMEFDRELDQHGTLFFSAKSVITDKEKEEIKKAIDSQDVEIHGKTKSKRLYNAMYVYCQQNRLDFERFYAEEMEKIIQHYKNKLQ